MKISQNTLNEIIDAYEENDTSQEYYLNLENGEVIFLFEFLEDYEELSQEIDEGFGEKYIRLPRTNSYEGYDDMVDFVNTVSSETVRKRLNKALNGGKGVFRKFKDELSYHGNELKRWYEFKYEKNRLRVLKWLEDQQIEID